MSGKVQLGEIDALGLVLELNVGHLIRSRVVGLLQDAVGTVGQRGGLGEIGIVDARVDSADGTVETRLVTVIQPIVVAEIDDSLLVHPAGVVLVGITGSRHTQQCRVLLAIVIQEKVVFCLRYRLHKVVLQANGVGLPVRSKDYLLGIQEYWVIVVVKVIGQVLERAREEAIQIYVRLSVPEAGEEHHLSVGREAPGGDFLHIHQKTFLPFLFFQIIGIIIAMALVFQRHTEQIAVGVPGNKGEGEVGVVLGLGITAEDAVGARLVRAFQPHANLAGLVGHIGETLLLRGERDAGIVALGPGALDHPVAFGLLALVVRMVHHVVVLVPVGEQLAVAHTCGVGNASLDGLRRARAV